MTHEATIRKWLTPEEVIKTPTDELRVAFNKALIHMSSMQRDLVNNMLTGKYSDAESARRAGYSTKTTNPGWEARKTKCVVHALHIGREIAARGAETTPEWIRGELKELLLNAKQAEDFTTITNVLKEFCKISGVYATEQLKVLHANHEGGALSKEISDAEWTALSSLQHELRVIDGEATEIEEH
ncbi:hypothetical protein N9100_01705 [Gammaproteobacteria bacterium]|nr:hypothetical protein [Gammaproteobacteria bacterium]